MTDRVLKAMAHPTVDILAHPTGRRINRREPFEMDVEAVLEAAADLGVAVELNANPNSEEDSFSLWRKISDQLQQQKYQQLEVFELYFLDFVY